MKRLSILLACLLFCLSSCYEIVETYIINPDGSGKVIIEATYLPHSSFKKEMEGKLEDLISEEVLKMNMYELLQNNAKGIEVWRDITFKAVPGGKIYFRGTAYFKDINKIKLQKSKYGVFGFYEIANAYEMHFDSKNQKQVFELVKHNGWDRSEVKQLSEEEIEAEMETAELEFADRNRPMPPDAKFKIEKKYKLSGTLEKYSNFNTKDGDTLTVSLGIEHMNIEKSMWTKDGYLRLYVLDKNNMNDRIVLENFENEIHFGENAAIRAEYNGEPQPLFDYTKEVKKATKNFEKLMKELAPYGEKIKRL